MYYIKDYKAGQKFYGIYLCKKKNILKTKAGRTYYALTLQDKTGVIDAKVWDLTNAIENFEQMDFIHTEGMVTTFQGSRQVNVNRIRKASEGEYDPAEYMPSSKYDTGTMYEDLLALVDTVNEPHLKKILDHFFREDKDFIKEFKVHSAAKTLHHGFVSGLLQHTLRVAQLCDFLSSVYDILDRNLLVTAALLHDIGKVYELTPFPENDYSDRGQMLGHIYIGARMVNEEIDKDPDFPEKLATELVHCILAHHGELEFGSPKKPCISEAIALNMADNTDAKLENITELYERSDATTDWLGYQKFYESYIRQSSGTVEKRKNHKDE